MARIPLCDPDDPDLDPKAAAILAAVREESGVDYNVLKGLANHPDALGPFLAFEAAVYPSRRLTPAQSEIAYYTAAVANSCHY